MKVIQNMKNKSLTLDIIMAGKIILAAIIAILFAQWLQLDYAISAGIVAILSISPTKKETIHTACTRFIAFLLALGIAYICFLALGVTIGGFFLFIVIYIILCQCKKWKSSMAMNSVLISHFITTGAINLDAIQNEVWLFIIGAGCGILVNLHLRKNQPEINKLKQEVDSGMRYVLVRMSQRITNHNLEDYNGKCLIILEDTLRNAQNVAHENFMNQFGDGDRQDINYLDRREKQLHILYNMYKKVKVLDTTPITGEKIAQFLFQLSDKFCDKHDCDLLLSQLSLLKQDMKSEILPQSRSEFEVRATLYCLMSELEEFLSIS